MPDDQTLRVTTRIADAWAGSVPGAVKSQCDYCHEPVWNDNIPHEGETGQVCTRCALSRPELRDNLDKNMLAMMEKALLFADAAKRKWN